MNAVFAKLICLKEADTPEFEEYAKNIVKNAKALCNKLEEL
jgi:glycine hydroxymethyltransferase